MKPILLSGHASEQLLRRGVSSDEVVTAIRSAPWQNSERGRLECRQNFTYESEWNGKFYQTKQVRPIFVDEVDEIVVVTVYAYYF